MDGHMTLHWHAVRHLGDDKTPSVRTDGICSTVRWKARVSNQSEESEGVASIVGPAGYTGSDGQIGCWEIRNCWLREQAVRKDVLLGYMRSRELSRDGF